MELTALSEEFQRRFDAVMAARETGLSASRKAIRSSANAIRAIHRGEMDAAEGLMDQARGALDEGSTALNAHPEIRHAGFLADAEKEYAEARVTAALVAGTDLPGPDDLSVGLAPYLNGMAEAIGEGRRAILDRLRTGEVGEGERLLSAMDDLYHVLVSMDYPDAITGNLRRITDVARGILEKTRGDLTTSLVQRDLKDTIERHAKGASS
ncbi:MAG: haloacid dehalogenase [Actinobacteria bacterium]|nr:haloacid dehalogenase [Actinomycetota bacterium]